MRNSLLLVVTLVLLGACTRVTVFGHTVKDGPTSTVAQPAAVTSNASAAPRSASAVQPGQSQIRRVTVELTAAAQQQTAADERFNADAVRDAVAAELGSRQLLDLQTTGAGRVAEIRLEEFAVRATSNVVMFGRLPSSGVLAGTVRIRDAAVGELQEFQVRAEIPLSIKRTSTDRNPLKNLYSGFARQLVDELTGTAPPPPPRR